jgi:uncharacterized protein YqiB (DUF1249 family)
MLADSYILPECIASPRSFGGLMTLYEANFIKLNQLVHDLSGREGYSVSYSDLDCNLHLSVEDRSKYTCDVRLTYLFPDVGNSLADPDLLARVYFDARMAEVRTLGHDHRHALLKSLHRQYKREVDRCWARNIMFSKWLDYLHEQGHGFEPIQPESPLNSLTVDSVKV